MALEKNDRRSNFLPLNLRNFTEDGKIRSLTWGSLNGNPRLTVFLDNTKKPDGTIDYNKMIIAPFKPLEMLTAIGYFKEVLKKGENDFEEIDCLYPKYVNNEKTEEKVLRAKIRFGIDKDGIAYFYVENVNGIKIKFNIVEEGWHLWRNGKNAADNKSKSELSQKHALSYLNILESLVKDLVIKEVTLGTNSTGDEPKKYNNYNKDKNNYQNYSTKKIVEEKVEEIIVPEKIETKTEVKEDFDDLF